MNSALLNSAADAKREMRQHQHLNKQTIYMFKLSYIAVLEGKTKVKDIHRTFQLMGKATNDFMQ